MSAPLVEPSGGRLCRAAQVVLFLAPIALSAIFAVRYFCPLPIWDYWDVLCNATAYADGGLGSVLSYFWEPFVDQRMVFPKAAIFTLSHLTGNRHYGLEIALGFVAQLIVLAAFLRLLRPDRFEGRCARTLLWLAPSFFLFWPVQAMRFQHHWFSTQYSLVLAPALLALLALARWPGAWRGLACALLGALVSGLSHGSGALFSVAVGVALLVFPGWNWKQRAACWGWTGIVMVAIRSGVPAHSGGSPGLLGALLTDQLTVLRYATGCLGTRPYPYLTGTLVLFLLALLTTILARAGRLRDPRLLPLGVVVFWMVGTALVTAAFRGRAGVDPHRQYQIFFALLPITVTALLVEAATCRGVRLARGLASPWVAAPLVLLGIGVWVIGYGDGLRQMRRLHGEVVRAAAYLSASPLVEHDPVRALFPHPRITTYHIPFLRDRGLLAQPHGRPPGTRAIRVRYRITERADLRIERGGPEGALLMSCAQQAHLTLAMDPPLTQGTILAFDIRLARPGLTLLRWQIAGAWNGPPDRRFLRRKADGRYWFRLTAHASGARSAVTALRLVFTVTRPGEALAVFRNLEAYERGE